MAKVKFFSLINVQLFNDVMLTVTISCCHKLSHDTLFFYYKVVFPNLYVAADRSATGDLTAARWKRVGVARDAQFWSDFKKKKPSDHH